MLILIVSVFLLSELPQGLLTVLSGVLNSHFYDHVYKGLGDFLDLLSLLNSLVTFILYCSMSGMYRKTFCQVFLIDRIRSLWSLLRTRWTSLQWRRRLVTSEDPLETSTLSPIKMPELFELVQTCPTNGLSTEAEFL